MTFGQLLVATVAGLGSIAYTSLAVWAWRTRDGLGWRIFCTLVSCDAAIAALLVIRAVDGHDPAFTWEYCSIVFLRFVTACLTTALAIALQKRWNAKKEAT